jgi:peptidoglycan hydrolase FlgJ
MGTLKAEAPVYTDLAGLAQLKRAAGKNDPAAIHTVAEQFEAMFTRMMLKSMRAAVGRDPLFGSDQQQMYQDMADDQLSVQLAKGKGFGLADMLVRQLQRMGVKGAEPTATATQAAAAYSATERASAADRTSGSAAATSEATKTSFVQDLWPQAEQAGQLLGVDPRHLIAQAALETNWGRNIPQDSLGRCSNNLFGMKATADWSGATVSAATQEFQGGAATGATAQFKAYATPAHSFQDYVALLRNNSRYSAALNTGGDVRAFASGLQRGGYATDPGYADKIAAVASAVAHKVGAAGELKFAAAAPIAASTGAL